MKVMVGIPSYNNEDTIGYVVQQAAEGLARYFGGGLVVNSDGGSKDMTREVVLKTEVPESVEVRSFIYSWPIPGKGSAVKELIEIARDENVDALILVDSDLRSITPEWILRLADPLRKGYDFVTPYYFRHKYDGTITNNIAYPMTVALYGRDVRQPIGGDFGISSKLFDIYLKSEDVWKGDVARFGIDIFLTTTAIGEGFNVCQAALGVKIHNPKDPATSLAPMFNQVVGTLFMLMIKYRSKWTKVRDITQVPILGDSERKTKPEPVKVSVDNLRQGALTLFSHNEWMLKKILSQNTFLEVKKAIRDYKLDDVLWSHVLYDAAVAYKDNMLKEAKVLVPLYFLKTLDFIVATKNMSTEKAEEIVKNRAKIFLEEKEYLIKRWRGEDS